MFEVEKSIIKRTIKGGNVEHCWGTSLVITGGSQASFVAYLVDIKIAVVVDIAERPDVTENVNGQPRFEQHIFGRITADKAINRVACRKDVLIVGLVFHRDGPLGGTWLCCCLPKRIKGVATRLLRYRCGRLGWEEQKLIKIFAFSKYVKTQIEGRPL